MKTLKSTFIITFLFAMAIANAQNWNLIWQDEFDYSGAPDPAKWNYTIWNPGMVNNEYQAYTDRSENVRVQDGALVIEGRRDWGNGHEYTSGRINSAWKGSFTYGRMEARMILPGGSGTWPAFWMMPDDPYKYATTCDASTGWDADCDAWPNSGEIDIMEYVGNDYGNVHGSIHSKHYYFKLGNQRTGHTYVQDPETNYHVYAIEWFEDHIDYFVDDVKYYTAWNDGTGWESWPFNHNFHIILNLAIGGDWGAAGGFDASVFERGAKMYVDYVRVYEADTTPQVCDAIELPALIEAESYCNYYGIQTETTADDGGGMNVGYIDANDWMDYTIDVPSSGIYELDFRIASLNGGGIIDIQSGNQTIASVNVPATGGWQNWATISETLSLAAGVQNLKVVAKTGGFNLNWIYINETPKLTTIALTPLTATINEGETLQYSASGFDQFGNAFATTFNWSTTGGSINQNGLYTASTVGTFTATAQSGSILKTASITVNPVNVGVEIPAIIEAEEWVDMSGVQTETCAEGGLNVGWIDAGDWLLYTINVPATGTYTVNYRVASAANGGSFQLQNVDGTVVYHTPSFSATGGWQNWTTISENIQLEAGTQNLKLVSQSSGWNLNYIEFTTLKSIVIEAEDFAIMNGIRTESCSEGGLNVGYTDPGDWMVYQQIDIPVAGTYTVEYRVASQAGYGAFQLEQNAGATALGQVNVPNTGGWQNWTTVSHTVQIENAGIQDFGIGISEGGFNLNWIKLTVGSSAKSAEIANRITTVSQALRIYPNPVDNFVNIETSGEINPIEIYNLLGHHIMTVESKQKLTKIDVSALDAGIYIIKVNNEVQRIIKN